MTTDTYQVACAKTARDFGTRELNLIYYALGLNGEAGEIAALVNEKVFETTLNPVDYLKGMRGEVGDTLWYVAQLGTIAGIPMSDIMEKAEAPMPMVVIRASNLLNAHAGAVAEIIKKVVRDGRPLHKPALTLALAKVVTMLSVLCKSSGGSGLYTLTHAADANIEKLAKRYPKGFFTVEDAIARADGEVLKE